MEVLMDITIIQDANYDDVYGMTQAVYAAREVDYRTQVGAFVDGIAGSNKFVESAGFRPHAETTALLNCARLGIPTQGSTLYAPWAACPSCAQSIITAGITRVVISRTAMEATPEDWIDRVNTGLGMLLDAGITVEMMQPIGMKITMRGQEVEV